MTLLEIIATHEAAHGERIGPTPKAVALAALRRLTRALADCEPQERAEVLVLLAGAIRPQIAQLATPCAFEAELIDA